MEFNCLIPKNMVEFSCIGSECEESCCAIGWNIDIDEETYSKYKHITNKSLRNHIISAIDKDKKNIIMKDGKCPLLEDGWCSIQKKFGYHYLSQTCKIYPRKVVNVQNMVEISYSLSCPEVVRKLILDEKPMEFNIETLDLGFKVSSLSVDSESQIYKYFWDIRGLSIKIIQNRNIDINNRLLVLGLFIQGLSECSNIESCIAKYELIAEQPTEAIRQLSNLEVSNTHCKLVFTRLYNIFKNIINNKQSKLAVKLAPLEDLFEIDFDKIYDEFIKVYKNEYLEFERSTQYIIENMIVHYIYDSKFPLNLSNLNMIDRYNIILLHILFYRMLMVLHYLKYRNFDLKLENYIQRVALIFDHNKIMELLNKNLKNEDMKFVHILSLIII